MMYEKVRLDLHIAYLTFYCVLNLLVNLPMKIISKNISRWTDSRNSQFSIVGMTQNMSCPENFARFFYKQCFFSFSLSVAKLFHELSFKCCLGVKIIIILRHFLYLIYLCPCLDLSLFVSYLCDLLFIFILSSRINRIYS